MITLLFFVGLAASVLFIVALDYEELRRKFVLKCKELAAMVLDAEELHRRNVSLLAENERLVVDNKRIISHYSYVLYSKNIPWKLVKWVEDMPNICAYVDKKVDFRKLYDPMRRPVRDERAIRQYNLIEFRFHMTLTERCPPELVAEQISECVKNAILEQWHSDTILLKDVFTNEDYRKANDLYSGLPTGR